MWLICILRLKGYEVYGPIELSCKKKCSECRPAPTEVYNRMTKEEKDLEMREACCRVRNNVPISYDDRYGNRNR